MDNEDIAKYRGTQTFFMNREQLTKYLRDKYLYAQTAEQRAEEWRERSRKNVITTRIKYNLSV